MEKKQSNFKGFRREITTLKSELQKIVQEKENWYKEKEEYKKQIIDLVNELKAVKNSKDSFNIVYNELRTNRDKLNNKVKDLIREIKKLRRDRKDLVKKLGITLDPEKIKEKIKFLEDKIQTEVLPFKKEETLMGEIRSLKKSLGESSAVVALDQKIESTSKMIEENKRKSQEYHMKLKELFKSHRKSGGYKDFISLSKQIEFLRTGQNMAYKMFGEFRMRFLALNKLLRHKLFEEGRIHNRIEDNRKRAAERKERETEILLEKKLKEVEEKLRTKKKLTTEDLIGLRK